MFNRFFLPILIFFSFNLSAQNTNSEIKSFFEKLIQDNVTSSLIDSTTLSNSNRLGINYYNVINKYLISFDIDQNIKQKIIANQLKYNLKINALDNEFSLVKFDAGNYSKDFYFQRNKLIYPHTYFTKDWETINSKYFKFIIQERKIFNAYAENKLNNFVEAILDLLNFNDKDKHYLENKKIIYILCKDEKDVEKLTGNASKGVYLLASDEIITSYNTHFHEITHLLINYKLNYLPLYTLPFFQEGFSSAVAGRGGISRNVILDIGKYLEQSDFINIQSIITYKNFYNEDASLTYPLSAFYNYFLIQHLGINNYLDIYKRFSGNLDYINSIKISDVQLPHPDDYQKFTIQYTNNENIHLNSQEIFDELLFSNQFAKVYDGVSKYKFMLKSNIFLSPYNKIDYYESNLFKELFPNIIYNGEKYCIKIDSREVNIYNLYTNALIASYNAGLTFESDELKNEEGYFVFYLDKNVFDEQIKEYNFFTF